MGLVRQDTTDDRFPDAIPAYHVIRNQRVCDVRPGDMVRVTNINHSKVPVLKPKKCKEFCLGKVYNVLIMVDNEPKVENWYFVLDGLKEQCKVNRNTLMTCVFSPYEVEILRGEP